ncbi:hypothetical protein C8E03_10885 [Lachnotalea glycerini]|uniref:Uncharacterized protein n=1 Tax=Lachnotalea glycerini TaxID=1763509 RepID=A0A255I897_9FIRM|nr:hypothetical protein [Lachnotalea glycerini]PXV88362.1 hypothetical protein C8E03_10885 [Lachnotalea glycerini]RDY29100.1 hypothetical protein CG710_018680 [Lachnotalea glycerini]
MKLQIKLLLISAILLTLFTSACNNTHTSNTVENISNNTSSHISKTLDTNLEVNADVISSPSSTLPVYNAHIYEPSAQQVQKAFFYDAPESELIYQSDTTEDDYSYKLKYQNRAYHYLGFQSYSNYDYYNYFTLISYFPDSAYELPQNFDNAGIKDAGSLSFMTKEDALSLVKNASNILGLYLEDTPFTCIALNSESLSTLYDYIGGSPELFYSEKDISFENDKGCYYIVWNQKSVNGESIMSENYSSNTLSGIGNCRGDYISAIVNEEGIVTFNSKVNYELDKSKCDEQIIDVEAALNCIKEKYSYIILEDPITITEINFCYTYTLIDRNSLTYEFIPTWSILSHNASDDSYSLTAINAVTGKIF